MENKQNQIKDSSDDELPIMKNDIVYRDESSDSWSDDESSSSSSSDSDFFQMVIESSGPKTLPEIKTRGELGLDDLPPIEDLTISVSEEELLSIGKIHAIVDKLVVVHGLKNMKPLDLDSVLFLSHNMPLGRVYDVFGPVAEPYYCVRFNSTNQINEKDIKIESTVYFAPKQVAITSYVILSELQKEKGSDASWQYNNEPPEEFVEYSDDEQEKIAKRNQIHRNRRKQINRSSDVSNKRSFLISQGGMTSRLDIFANKNIQNSASETYRDDTNGRWFSRNNWVENERRPFPFPPYPPLLPSGAPPNLFFGKHNFPPPHFTPRNNWNRPSWLTNVPSKVDACNKSVSLPVSVGDQNNVSSTNKKFCIGKETTAFPPLFYSSVLPVPSKVDVWNKSISFPVSVGDQNSASSTNEEFCVGKETTAFPPLFYSSVPPPPPPPPAPLNGQNVPFINTNIPPPITPPSNLPLSKIETIQTHRVKTNGRWFGENNWVENERRPIPPPPGPPPMSFGALQNCFFGKHNFPPQHFTPKNNLNFSLTESEKEFYRPYGPPQNIFISK